MTDDELRSKMAGMIGRAYSALDSAKREMVALNEPCDHAVGVCWCSYHIALEHITAVADEIEIWMLGKKVKHEAD